MLPPATLLAIRVAILVTLSVAGPVLATYGAEPPAATSARDVDASPDPVELYSERRGKNDPAPKIPRPAAPPADTRYSIDLKLPGGITLDQPAISDEVSLVSIPPSKLPRLTGAAGPLPPIRLEASYTEPTTLQAVLVRALHKNLPIKIAAAEYQAKRYNQVAAFGELLPGMAMGYSTLRTLFKGGSADDASFYNVIYLPVFNGGQDVFRLLKTRHEARAANFVTSATTNNTLLDVYDKYQDLLLAYALLNVRVKAVDLSNSQLQENVDRKAAGEGTIFEVLQSQTRLAQDQQQLLRQQVAFRKAALHLAVAINVSPGTNLLPEDGSLAESLLVDPKLSVADMLTQAVDHRPELKEYEQLRLAARRRIQESLGPLYPNAKFFLATNTQPKSDSSGGVIIPTGNVLSGGLVTTGGGGATNTFTGGFFLNWFLPGMGVIAAGNAMSLKEQARKITLQANDTLLKVLEEVRASYLEMLTTREEIAVTRSAVTSAREELRVAHYRVCYGVGTNLELLSAQKDYFEALSRQAEAIVSYRKSQARLLRDTGTISVAALTTDRRPLKVR